METPQPPSEANGPVKTSLVESTDASIISTTVQWLERAVIGLNLCPFAKAVHVKKQIRYVVSAATTPEQLLTDLRAELALLSQSPAEKIATTLLIHPKVLADFLDYNDFLAVADDMLLALELDGEIQIASFHPRYQFADTLPNDIDNFTNRSPYPMLHLLREDSVTQAVEAFPEAETIFEKNIETLRKMGHQGWKALGLAET